MQLSDFDFTLPEALIALHPVTPRRAARLFVQDGPKTTLAEMADLATFLKPGDHLVFNDTRVIPARLMGTRHRDGNAAGVEILLTSQLSATDWQSLARPAKKCAPGDRITFEGGLEAEVLSRNAGEVTIRFASEGEAFRDQLNTAGAMPLPPYIAGKRPADDTDKTRYQTVFADKDGAVAAPTAALHFDDVLFADLEAAGIAKTFVTLHVGPGTFLPVKVDDIADHKMHSEWGEVTEDAARAINETRANGGRIIPVGTTALRLLESAAAPDGTLQPFAGDTDIFIKPGYTFRITDGLITNFHLPKSTLLMLVSALMGRDRMLEVYDRAIAESFRFYSYGDGSLLIPER